MDIRARLTTLGLTLPQVPKPVAAYVPGVVCGELVYVSGQLPVVNGRLESAGPVPSAVNVDGAKAAAAQCVLGGLAVVDHMIDGDWARFQRVVRLGVFVLSDRGFCDQSLVADGASELLQKLFGDKGRHARVAVGVAALPLGAAVELEMTVAVNDVTYSY